jgi:hypothetical protein
MSKAEPHQEPTRLDKRRRILLEERYSWQKELKIMGSIIRAVGIEISIGKWPNEETLAAYPSIAALKTLGDKIAESGKELAEIERQIALQQQTEIGKLPD